MNEWMCYSKVKPVKIPILSIRTGQLEAWSARPIINQTKGCQDPESKSLISIIIGVAVSFLRPSSVRHGPQNRLGRPFVGSLERVAVNHR